jgi:hypothetical protein
MYSIGDNTVQMVRLRSGTYINLSLVAAVYQTDDEDAPKDSWEVAFGKGDGDIMTIIITKDEYEELDRKMRERFYVA